MLKIIVIKVIILILALPSLAELVAYIDDIRVSANVAPVFKLSNFTCLDLVFN